MPDLLGFDDTAALRHVTDHAPDFETYWGYFLRTAPFRGFIAILTAPQLLVAAIAVLFGGPEWNQDVYNGVGYGKHL